MNLYPLNNAIGFANAYPLESDFSGGHRYPTFEQRGPVPCEYCPDKFLSWLKNRAVTCKRNLKCSGLGNQVNGVSYRLHKESNRT